MRVFIPNPLRSYTNGAGTVDAHGRTLDELTADLDRRFAGLRFRVIDEQRQIRPHIRFFVNGQSVRELSRALSDSDEVMIVCALSGG